jgi:hypothetical protein
MPAAAAAVPASCQVSSQSAYGSTPGAQQALDDWLDTEAERLVCEVMGAAAAVQQRQLHLQHHQPPQQQLQQQQQRMPLETCQAIARSIMALEQHHQQQQQQLVEQPQLQQQQSMPSQPWQQYQQPLPPQACLGLSIGW